MGEATIRTVKDMGWLGKKNGELLRLAASNEFNFFITLDKNLKNQQNLEKVGLKFIILHAINNKPQTIEAFGDKINEVIEDENAAKISELRLD